MRAWFKGFCFWVTEGPTPRALAVAVAFFTQLELR